MPRTLIALLLTAATSLAVAGESMPTRLMIGVEVVKRGGGVGGGVKIVKVFEDSPAKEIGLRANMVLLEIDGKPANDPRELQTYVLGRQEAEETFRLVYRDGPKFFAVTVDVITEEREISVTAPRGRRGTRVELVKRWKVLSREELPPPMFK